MMGGIPSSRWRVWIGQTERIAQEEESRDRMLKAAGAEADPQIVVSGEIFPKVTVTIGAIARRRAYASGWHAGPTPLPYRIQTCCGS